MIYYFHSTPINKYVLMKFKFSPIFFSISVGGLKFSHSYPVRVWMKSHLHLQQVEHIVDLLHTQVEHIVDVLHTQVQHILNLFHTQVEYCRLIAYPREHIVDLPHTQENIHIVDLLHSQVEHFVDLLHTQVEHLVDLGSTLTGDRSNRYSRHHCPHLCPENHCIIRLPPYSCFSFFLYSYFPGDLFHSCIIIFNIPIAISWCISRTVLYLPFSFNFISLQCLSSYIYMFLYYLILCRYLISIIYHILFCYVFWKKWKFQNFVFLFVIPNP